MTPAARRGWAAALALACMAAGVPVVAHEPGTTRIDVEIASSGEVQVRVPIDPLVVWRRRELDAGRVPTMTPTIDQLRDVGLEAAVLSAVTMTAGDEPVHLRVAGSDWQDALGAAGTPMDARIGRPAATSRTSSVVVTLAGHVPSGTRAFTWRYDGLDAAYPLRILQPGRAEPRVDWMRPGRISPPLSLSPPGLERVAVQYAWLGVVHIVPRGLDHILFVLSLCLLAPRARTLLAQVSTFTVAHTVTLGAGALGWIALPAAIVEPLIAASIAWIAIENVRAPVLSGSRVSIVFLFGLLHGAGFAGVLGELGLPEGTRLLALAAFNVGVEAGQLLVIAAALACKTALTRWPHVYRGWVVVPASIATAAVGAYWTVVRVIEAAGG